MGSEMCIRDRLYMVGRFVCCWADGATAVGGCVGGWYLSAQPGLWVVERVSK